ncbi:MAG: hypothetical protein WA667_30495 [Candidatus Nitrosopolaris sp.]
MQRRRQVLLFLLYGGIGFAGGFYLAVWFQKQIEVLVSAAIALAVLTWVGSGADLVGLLREWAMDQREQERIPSLAFDGFWKKKMKVVSDKKNYILLKSDKSWLFDIPSKSIAFKFFGKATSSSGSFMDNIHFLKMF